MKSKVITSLLVLLLAGISLAVAIGKFNNKAMWLLIFLYWVVLTIKNIVDLIGMKGK